MQYIDFITENLTYHQSENHYSLEIPRETIGFGEIKVQKKNDDGSYEDADAVLSEYDDKVVILVSHASDLRIEF
nr:hypothetical protein [uncultured Chryseobacterium sp.]